MTTLLFAGGGTGGHVFPMIAVADAVRALAPAVRLVFVGTEQGMEATLVPERGYELSLLRVLPIRGGGLGGALRGIAQAARSIPQARSLLAKVGPSAVFSIGGYAAGPVALAARTLGIPVALMEPNGEIGLANRLVAPFVQRAYIAFPESARHFERSIVVRTGVPLRAGFQPRSYARRSGPPRVLVLGGSQGAQSLNDAVPRALAKLATQVEIVHQCGRAHERAARAVYAELGLAPRARVVPFIDDMPAALAEADLIVGRAGASAVSEICAVGRASLLVPYPFAGDHQKVNADSLAREGAALWVPNAEATPERLARELAALFAAPERLSALAEAARRIGRPEAARVIAEDLLRLAAAAGERAATGARPAVSEDGPLQLTEAG